MDTTIVTSQLGAISFGFIKILVPILIIAFLIFVHELGHFLAAKAVGIQVDKFALGFGPVLYKFDYKGTEYSLRAIFLGGYVQMFGDDDPSSTTHNEDLRHDPRSFLSKTLAQKILVLTAGVIMNFIFGILFFIIYLSFVDGVVGLQKVGDYSFIGAEKYENTYFLTSEFREEDSDIGFILTIDGEIPENRADFVSILEQGYEKEFALELFDGNGVVEIDMVLNGDNIRSNFDLDLFTSPEADTNDFVRRALITSVDLDNGVLRDGVFTVNQNTVVGGTDFLVSEHSEELEGDYILRLAETSVISSEDLGRIITENLGQTVDLDLVDENGEYRTIEITLPAEIEEGTPVLGVGIIYSPLGYGDEVLLYRYSNPITGGFTHSVNTIGYQVYALGYLIGDAIDGNPEQLAENVGGVVAIGGQISEVVDVARNVDSAVIVELFNVTATISLVLAFMNILPIPVLDGGQVVFVLLEKLRGKPLPKRLEGIIYTVFVSVLILLTVIVTVRDLFRLF